MAGSCLCELNEYYFFLIQLEKCC